MVIKTDEEQVRLSYRGTWPGLGQASDRWPPGDEMIRVDVLGERLLSPLERWGEEGLNEGVPGKI